MASQRLRDQYVVGKLGSYLCPTVASVDEHLRKLHKALPDACGAPLMRIQHDLDKLLERRLALQREAT